MTLNILNQRHEISVEAYNEGVAVRGTGGIIERTKSDSVTLKIIYIHIGSRERRTNDGIRYREERFIFQVRNEELQEKNFQLIEGRTHFVKDGNTFRVNEIMDFSMYPLTKTIQGIAIRKVNVE